MSNLKFSILSIPADGLSVNETVLIKNIRPEWGEPLPVTSVTVSGRITCMGTDFLFHGYVKGTFEHPCDRCLENAQCDFDNEVFWHFDEYPKNPNDKDYDDEEGTVDIDTTLVPEFLTYHNGEIDLGSRVWDEVCFALPIKFLCKEDCKGLCPSCGNNRNNAPCDCPKLDFDASSSASSFSKLSELYPDLPESSTNN